MKKTERINISTLFESGAFTDNNVTHRPNLLLFDHFIRKFQVQVSGGKVKTVQTDIVN